MNMEVSETSSCVPGYHIYKHVWDAVIGEFIGEELQCDLIQTEAIGMQSSLRDGIITGNLLHKYHEPVPYS